MHELRQAGAVVWRAAIDLGIGDDDTFPVRPNPTMPPSGPRGPGVARELPLAEFPAWVAQRSHGVAGAFLYGSVTRGYLTADDPEPSWEPDVDGPRVPRRRRDRLTGGRMMPEKRRTGLPEVDALIEAHEAAQGKLDDTIVVSQAETTVATARQAELAEQQKAALHRWSAAQGLLTKAQKDGNAAKIAAARRAATAPTRVHADLRRGDRGDAADHPPPGWKAWTPCSTRWAGPETPVRP